MASAKIIAAVFVALAGFGVILGTTSAMPAPDSAGTVEMVNGLAYGGIPYGSISGMLANYNQPQRQPAYAYNSIQASASVLVPDTRTAPIVGY